MAKEVEISEKDAATLMITETHRPSLANGQVQIPGRYESYWPLANWLGEGMVALHDATGLGWAGVIGAAAVGMRCALFPVNVLAQRNAAKMHNISPQQKKLQNRMKDAQASGDIIASRALLPCVL